MPVLRVLKPNEQKRYEHPPIFEETTRKIYLSFTDEVKDAIKQARTPATKVFFLLLHGYFRASSRFYTPDRFYEKDIRYVCHQLKIYRKRVDFSNYSRATYLRIKQQILDLTAHFSFDEKAYEMISKEAYEVLPNQMKPRLIFLHLIEALRGKRIELPSYHRLANIIIEQSNRYTEKQQLLLAQKLTLSDRELLDALLAKLVDEEKGEKTEPYNRYKITLLKKIYQSTKLYKVKANVEDLIILKGYHNRIQGILESVGFTPQTIRYYAEAVLRYRVYQIDRRNPMDKYLHLLCFIAHQVYYLQDVLVDTLIAIIRSVNSSITRKHKDNYYEQRQERLRAAQQAIRMARESYQANAFSKNELRKIVKDPALSSEEKVIAIAAMIDSEEESQVFLQNRLEHLNTLSQNISHKETTYDILERQAKSVQRKLNPVVIHLNFDKTQSDKDLIKAIDHFKSKEGNINKKAPQSFLTKEEQDNLYQENGKFRVSLYKMFLFRHLFNGIKAGKLNLGNSYKFKSFSHYLIPLALWKAQRKQLLERASLTDMANFSDVLTFLKKQLNDAYEQTNERILEEANKHISFRKDGSYSVNTPKVDKVDKDKLAVFFPREEYVPLLQVLTTIDATTNFLDCFQPWKEKYEKVRPDRSSFLAAIIGYGCNIGIHKMEKISRNRAKGRLTNIANWYFSQENIDDANSRIVDFMNALELPNIYLDNESELHTSSDGQKVSVAVDSLLASHSFKYFGKGKGVSVYGFTDSRDFNFYSMVNSPADRESTFVFDGLVHNDNIKSTMHSTDTHGQSEAAFALAYLLGFKLAPRISKLSDCTLYSLEKKEVYIDRDYKILPTKYIKTELIEKHWDEILRFVVTIKLKICTPSQLFKRLNSYSKQHPIYKALKELGHVIRTIFVLDYIDDLELRQAIEKQLNKIENSNKFNKAVCVGEEEFQQGTKEEMEVVDGCRRLIKNALICWNYLYLSKKINEEESLERKQQMIESIRSGSIVTWKHFNLEGFYDFADDQVKDSFNLMDAININLNAILISNKD